MLRHWKMHVQASTASPFGRTPIIPCRLPTRSLARLEPVTFADSVTSAQPSS